MPSVSNRVAVLHGVNFDVLERRDPRIYGGISLSGRLLTFYTQAADGTGLPQIRWAILPE